MSSIGQARLSNDTEISRSQEAIQHMGGFASTRRLQGIAWIAVGRCLASQARFF